jgi:hypothetical protein
LTPSYLGVYFGLVLVVNSVPGREEVVEKIRARGIRFLNLERCYLR